MPYPDDYDSRRNPENRRPSDEHMRQIEETHLLLDATEKIKEDIDDMVAHSNSPITKGEAYYLLSDGLSDIGHVMIGGGDLDATGYRNDRPAIRDWDAETERYAVKRKAEAEVRERSWQEKVAAQPKGTGIKR